jgi:glycosyltransferase involved in cell wall biosynthesis
MSSDPTLSVLVASCGRPSLTNTLVSISRQMLPGDQLLVDVNDDSPWGNRARNRMMPHATGDGLLFMDDDDIYHPAAFEVIRAAFAEDPERMHVFKMRYPDGRELWKVPELVCDNVSTQMVCVPNMRLGVWGDRYAGDFDFFESTSWVQGPPAFHDNVIVLYGRDPEMRG